MQNKLLIMISGVIILILITIGVSYAYFTANLTGGEDSTTITVSGGTMNIIYNGGATINVANIIPDNNPVTTKTFTVTGNNTTDVEMYYKLNLIVETNTFSEEALKYKLISTNTNNNGKIVPSITTFTNIGSGPKIIELGIANFDTPTNGNKVHTYNLEIYFPNTGASQNIDQEKEIKAHVEIVNTSKPTFLLTESILNQGGGLLAIEAKGTPDFSVINGTSGLYASQDEYGTSYYYRGLKTELNNNLIFGGFQWKIIRINGDGSIRLIYNGTEEQFNSNSAVNNTGGNTQISGWHAWNNTSRNDAKYVGYMYGGANGAVSTSRNGITSSAATYNETSTNVKTQLDSWYQTNISGKPFENKIIDNLFCNDRQLQNEVGGTSTGPGYGYSESLYATHYRLKSTKNPTLKCAQKNDRFTANNIILGNGALTYSVGLITADEIAMAGAVYQEYDATNYLYTSETYWTLSPSHMNNNYAIVYYIEPYSSLNANHVYLTSGIRPVISIDPMMRVTGEGTSSNPFKAV